MKKQYLILALAALSALPATMHAQTAQETPTQADTATLESVSKKVTTFQKILDALPRFSGYLQVGYSYKHNAGGIADDNASSFNIKHFRLSMMGDISKTFDYKMQIEGFSSSHTTDNKALISILDLYMRAKIRPEIEFWAGQFPMALTMEHYDMSPGTIETPNYSQLVSKLVFRNPITGVTGYARDCGVQAAGSAIHKEGYDVLSYNLQLVNGSPSNQADDNKSKDIIARLVVSPVKGLRISGSLDWGEYTNHAVAQNYIPMTRYAVGAWYDGHGLFARAEYGHAGSDSHYSDVDTGERVRGRVDEQSYYIVAGYTFAGKYAPVLRYDAYNNRHNTYQPASEGKQQDFLVGFLYNPINHLKVQADYTLSHYSFAGAKNTSMFEVAVIGYF